MVLEFKSSISRGVCCSFCDVLSAPDTAEWWCSAGRAAGLPPGNYLSCTECTRKARILLMFSLTGVKQMFCCSKSVFKYCSIFRVTGRPIVLTCSRYPAPLETTTTGSSASLEVTVTQRTLQMQLKINWRKHSQKLFIQTVMIHHQA